MKSLGNVLSSSEITYKRGLRTYKMIGSIAKLPFLRADGLVTISRDLNSRGNDNGYIRGCTVGCIVVKRKPARRIHKVRPFVTNVSKTLCCQRAALRRN